MTRLARLPWSKHRRSSGAEKNWETSERQEPIQEACRRLHLRCERNATGMGRGLTNKNVIKLHSEGTWDLEVYDPDHGFSAMVECKMPGQGLSEAQVAWGLVYRACGKELIVATSVQEFLNELAYVRERRRRERVVVVDRLDDNKNVAVEVCDVSGT